MAEFFKVHTGQVAFTCLEWMQAFFTCCNEPLLKHKTVTWVEKKTIHVDRVTKQKTPRTRKIRVIKWVTTVGREKCFRLMMDLARSFCSYIKHGERAKLQRRAIASANIILRVFLYAIEEMHLSLSKEMFGSTIGVGAEEKKRRITTTMQSGLINHPDMTHQAQSTQDATKWNECMSADLFSLLHLTFFDPKVRSEMDLPEITNDEMAFATTALLGTICLLVK